MGLKSSKLTPNDVEVRYEAECKLQANGSRPKLAILKLVLLQAKSACIELVIDCKRYHVPFHKVRDNKAQGDQLRLFIEIEQQCGKVTYELSFTCADDIRPFVALMQLHKSCWTFTNENSSSCGSSEPTIESSNCGSSEPSTSSATVQTIAKKNVDKKEDPFYAQCEMYLFDKYNYEWGFHARGVVFIKFCPKNGLIQYDHFRVLVYDYNTRQCKLNTEVEIPANFLECCFERDADVCTWKCIDYSENENGVVVHVSLNLLNAKGDPDPDVAKCFHLCMKEASFLNKKLSELETTKRVQLVEKYSRFTEKINIDVSACYTVSQAVEENDDDTIPEDNNEFIIKIETNSSVFYQPNAIVKRSWSDVLALYNSINDSKQKNDSSPPIPALPTDDTSFEKRCEFIENCLDIWKINNRRNSLLLLFLCDIEELLQEVDRLQKEELLKEAERLQKAKLLQQEAKLHTWRRKTFSAYVKDYRDSELEMEICKSLANKEYTNCDNDKFETSKQFKNDEEGRKGVRHMLESFFKLPPLKDDNDKEAKEAREKEAELQKKLIKEMIKRIFWRRGEVSLSVDKVFMKFKGNGQRIEKWFFHVHPTDVDQPDFFVDFDARIYKRFEDFLKNFLFNWPALVKESTDDVVHFHIFHRHYKCPTEITFERTAEVIIYKRYRSSFETKLDKMSNAWYNRILNNRLVKYLVKYRDGIIQRLCISTSFIAFALSVGSIGGLTAIPAWLCVGFGAPSLFYATLTSGCFLVDRRVHHQAVFCREMFPELLSFGTGVISIAAPFVGPYFINKLTNLAASGEILQITRTTKNMYNTAQILQLGNSIVSVANTHVIAPCLHDMPFPLVQLGGQLYNQIHDPRPREIPMLLMNLAGQLFSIVMIFRSIQNYKSAEKMIDHILNERNINFSNNVPEIMEKIAEQLADDNLELIGINVMELQKGTVEEQQFVQYYKEGNRLVKGEMRTITLAEKDFITKTYKQKLEGYISKYGEREGLAAMIRDEIVPFEKDTRQIFGKDMYSFRPPEEQMTNASNQVDARNEQNLESIYTNAKPSPDEHLPGTSYGGNTLTKVNDAHKKNIVQQLETDKQSYLTAYNDGLEHAQNRDNLVEQALERMVQTGWLDSVLERHLSGDPSLFVNLSRREQVQIFTNLYHENLNEGLNGNILLKNTYNALRDKANNDMGNRQNQDMLFAQNAPIEIMFQAKDNPAAAQILGEMSNEINEARWRGWCKYPDNMSEYAKPERNTSYHIDVLNGVFKKTDVYGNSVSRCSGNDIGTKNAFQVRSYYKEERWWWYDKEVPCDAQVMEMKASFYNGGSFSMDNYYIRSHHFDPKEVILSLLKGAVRVYNGDLLGAIATTFGDISLLIARAELGPQEFDNFAQFMRFYGIGVAGLSMEPTQFAIHATAEVCILADPNCEFVMRTFQGVTDCVFIVKNGGKLPDVIQSIANNVSAAMKHPEIGSLAGIGLGIANAQQDGIVPVIRSIDRLANQVFDTPSGVVVAGLKMVSTNSKSTGSIMPAPPAADHKSKGKGMQNNACKVTLDLVEEENSTSKKQNDLAKEHEAPQQNFTEDMPSTSTASEQIACKVNDDNYKNLFCNKEEAKKYEKYKKLYCDKKENEDTLFCNKVRRDNYKKLFCNKADGNNNENENLICNMMSDDFDVFCKVDGSNDNNLFCNLPSHCITDESSSQNNICTPKFEDKKRFWSVTGKEMHLQANDCTGNSVRLDVEPSGTSWETPLARIPEYQNFRSDIANSIKKGGVCFAGVFTPLGRAVIPKSTTALACLDAGKSTLNAAKTFYNMYYDHTSYADAKIELIDGSTFVEARARDAQSGKGLNLSFENIANGQSTSQASLKDAHTGIFKFVQDKDGNILSGHLHAFSKYHEPKPLLMCNGQKAACHYVLTGRDNVTVDCDCKDINQPDSKTWVPSAQLPKILDEYTRTGSSKFNLWDNVRDTLLESIDQQQYNKIDYKSYVKKK